MKHNVVAPSVGESITEVSILKWAKENGQAVKSGDLLLEIESDKATVEIVAENNGALTILKQAGERIPVGEVIGFVDDSIAGAVREAAGAAKAAPTPAPSKPGASSAAASTSPAFSPAAPGMGPAARKAMAESGLSPNLVQGTGPQGRITKADVLGAASGNVPAYGASSMPGPVASELTSQARVAPAPAAAAPAALKPGDRRVPMSTLRARIAERLVQAQRTAAILTTFNEADMSAVMQLRSQHKDAFKAKHGVPLGFMSFFTRACVEAFKVVPEVNAQIDGRDVIYHDYVDMGIAVGSDRGLVVPIVRDAHKMGFVEIEKKIAELAVKARDGKLSIADMSGGTFTISNGGVYGSLLSTPILNMPQAGILGMHKIQERPVAVNGKVEVRPMMYLALSYDHRLIDGKGAVTFLVALKEMLENPEKLSLQY